MYLVIQDGRKFFDDETGDELFESSIIVEDGDLTAASLAKQEFIEYASRRGYEMTTVDGELMLFEPKEDTALEL